MKLFAALLILLLGILQYKLWIGGDSLTEVKSLEETRHALMQENAMLSERNESLEAEVIDLKHGKEALEERARTEMGMIKTDELFFQIVDRHHLPGIERE